MKILPQLTQRQCKHFTIQDMNEQLNLEITYTKSLLQVLQENNLVKKELHYICPECHSQNVFVCDGFDSLYQCYQCGAKMDPARVEAEGRPFYSVSKDDFMQYVKEKYPDLYQTTAEPEKEIIPFRPVVVESSEEKEAAVFEKDIVEKIDTKAMTAVKEHEDRITDLENDRKVKRLFWTIVKMITLSVIMICSTLFVLYEWFDIFFLKDQHPFLYEVFVFAMKGSVVKIDDWGGVFITLLSAILTLIVGKFDVFGWKKLKKYYNEIKEELMKREKNTLI